MDDALQAEIDEGYARRDRDDMAPTIAYFEELLARHPGVPELLAEVGGAYDTAGRESQAVVFYEEAMRAGLAGDALRRCLLQYGSTLRNLGDRPGALAALDRAHREFPDSASVVVFRALALHSAGRSDEAVGSLVALIAENPIGDSGRYRAAEAGYAAELLGEG